MKNIKLLSLVVLASIVLTPVLVIAQENDTTTPANTPAVTTAPTTIREKLRNEVQAKIQNVKANQEVRNNILDARKDLKNATTSEQKQSIRTEIRQEIFNAQLNKIVKELRTSINNLKQIRTRMVSRIEKATTAGRDMTKPKSLLAIADEKIASAEKAIESLVTYQPEIVTNTTSNTTKVKLEKPREVSSEAIKAVTDARKALNDVVVSIAKNMGLKLATPTPTPTTDSVSTPTPTPTPTETTTIGQ